jgi:5-methylcytosine-specific restriction endonuclease McrA
MRCRSRVWDALKTQDGIKSQKTFDLIGCSPEFFRQYLESQFTKEMSWDNYGKFWEIDHRIPVSKFDLSKADQQKRAFNYSNCRPLNGKENSAKKDKMPGPHQALLI